MDVDEVDRVAGLDEDGDERERAVSGEVVAFEVDVEDGVCAYAVDEGFEPLGFIDHFDFHFAGVCGGWMAIDGWCRWRGCVFWKAADSFLYTGCSKQ